MNAPAPHPDADAYAVELTAWRDELDALRAILLAIDGLEETIKWRKPCYVGGGGNVAIFQPFRDQCALMFFQGALLDDPSGALREQGEHSRSAMRLEFRSIADVTGARDVITALVSDAIRVNERGERVERTPADEPPYPEELALALDSDPALRDAWDRLTPGRRRGYLLHFGDAKQPATRIARIERHAPRILEGFGMHD